MTTVMNEFAYYSREY